MNKVGDDGGETVVGAADDQLARATAFFASWGRSHEELLESFGVLADDCRWIQRPIPTVVGSNAARRFLGLARKTMGLETIDVDVLKAVADHDTVVVERIDHLRRADGSLIVSAPVVGVLEFRGGQIVRWREYFDSLEFAGQVARSTAALGLRRIGRVMTKALSAAAR